MFASLSLIWLISVFLGAAAIVWFAGTWLSDSTDVLSSRLHLGQALGGIILLAISTNLPVARYLGTGVGHAVARDLDPEVRLAGHGCGVQGEQGEAQGLGQLRQEAAGGPSSTRTIEVTIYPSMQHLP